MEGGSADREFTGSLYGADPILCRVRRSGGSGSMRTITSGEARDTCATVRSVLTSDLGAAPSSTTRKGGAPWVQRSLSETHAESPAAVTPASCGNRTNHSSASARVRPHFKTPDLPDPRNAKILVATLTSPSHGSSCHAPGLLR